ncbi:DRBM domain-containing protein [Favolaschia claudopus]|uniref:DRBM domain-containing protein n=1 Tax=Favolaschia claudopus TaxID=2862362 RepID=A0AAW0ADQ8_9AGAR
MRFFKSIYPSTINIIADRRPRLSLLPSQCPICHCKMTRQPHPRTTLNNVAQQWGSIVTYEDSSTGPLNNPTWTAIVYLNGIEHGRANGATRSAARDRAAQAALRALGM